MWVTVYISQKSEDAEKIKACLESSDIAVKFKRSEGEDNGESCYEILVPSREVAEAHELILDAEL